MKSTFNVHNAARGAAWLLQERLESHSIMSLVEREKDATIQWHLNSDLNEGHRITITPSQINIEAGNSDGFYCASASLFLLFFFHKEKGSIPCQTIEDSPKYRWRGCHFDCARHFFPLRFLKKLIELCSLMKFNVFHLHFCDDQAWRIALPEFPKLTEIGAWRKIGDRNHGGFYTEKDLQSLISYAQERGINIVPECEMPGHCSAALVAYPDWAVRKLHSTVPSYWGIFEDAYNIADPRVRDHLKSILAKISNIFPSKYIHIGGDEVPPIALESVAEKYGGIKHLQDDFFKDICDFLIARGKTPLVWDEALEHNPPKETIGMVWQKAEYAEPAIRKGYNVVLCLQDSGCYLDHGYAKTKNGPGRLGVYSIEETARLQFPKLDRKMVLGAQAAIWTEGMSAEWEAEQLIFPRLCILAQRFWSDTLFDMKNLDSLYGLLDRYEVVYYKQ